MRRVAAPLRAALIALLAVATPGRAQQPFDFWVVTLAWSPEFCHNAPEFGGERQCAEAHGFVLTRLEPWTAAGPLQGCAEPAEDLSGELVSHVADTMFNRRWIRYEWQRQGHCSGLDPDEYFVQAQYLANRIAIPADFQQPFGVLDADAAQIRERFARANRDGSLAAAAVALRCDRGWLSEVRFCVDRDYRYRDCTAVPNTRCGAQIRVRGFSGSLKTPEVD